MTTTKVPIASRKFHFGLAVTDLARSSHFYRKLLAAEPMKETEDYVRFETEDPPLVLALHPGKFSSSGALNHVGFRVADSAKLVKFQERLEVQGIATQREEGVECCYSRQTKFWVPDPDGNLWEIYTLHEDLDHAGFGAHEVERSSTQVGDVSSVAWEHMLTQPLPSRIPGDDNSVDEVLLQGTFNLNVQSTRLAKFLAEVNRVLRPGGCIWVHALAADRAFTDHPNLPGPASLVEFIPAHLAIRSALAAAGFEGLYYEKFMPIHCFAIDGFELRQLQLKATKRHSHKTNTQHAVIYRGPFDEVIDEQGLVFPRGVRKSIDDACWEKLRLSQYRECFFFFPV